MGGGTGQGEGLTLAPDRGETVPGIPAEDFPFFLGRGEVNIRLFYILYGRFCEVFVVFAGVGFAKCLLGVGFAKCLQGVGNLTSAISLYSLS